MNPNKENTNVPKTNLAKVEANSYRRVWKIFIFERPCIPLIARA